MNGDHQTAAGSRVFFGDGHRERLTDEGRCGERDNFFDGSWRRYKGRSGFDAGGAEIVNSLRRGGHRRARITKVPYRRTFRQCNDDEVPRNGRVHHMTSQHGGGR